MKLAVILFCLGILSGCSSVQQTSDKNAPVLLVQRPFPAFPISFFKPNIFLDADIYIRDDGTVSNVILKTGSGIKSWDSAATAIISTWQYSPMRVNNKPAACWIHQKMKVISAEPIIYSLSALLFPTYQIADSIYTDLIGGSNFEEIAKNISLYPELGRHIEMGEVNIYQYSELIRNSITNLSEGEFTKPIKYDDHYIIFKRVQTVAK
ncbi:MAG: energy transducer TonB [Ignavibacteriaceae bacterium]|nr:energy transducer TonB [Ignavibacteriaceae bacterium]